MRIFCFDVKYIGWKRRIDDTKWQSLALAGKSIAAVKEYREAYKVFVKKNVSGIVYTYPGLADSKNAVEMFMASHGLSFWPKGKD
jgi:hypothetical protein